MEPNNTTYIGRIKFCLFAMQKNRTQLYSGVEKKQQGSFVLNGVINITKFLI